METFCAHSEAKAQRCARFFVFPLFLTPSPRSFMELSRAVGHGFGGTGAPFCAAGH